MIHGASYASDGDRITAVGVYEKDWAILHRNQDAIEHAVRGLTNPTVPTDEAMAHTIHRTLMIVVQMLNHRTLETNFFNKMIDERGV
jgi:hypothetical protein